MLDLEFSQLSDTGLQRDHNEDSLGYFSPANPQDAGSRRWLFALADGVGGHDRGEVASRVAIDAIVSEFGRLSQDEPLTAALPKLLQAANAKVFEAAHSAAGTSNMATTMVACAFRYDRAVVAHAGDSRCYLVRRGYAASVTRDHTVTSDQVRLGLLTAAEARNSTSSHILSRALGVNMFLSVDSSEHQIYADDIFLLCSDGLHHSVKEDDIVRLTSNNASLDVAAKELVELANQRDGSDNVSVQLIRIREVERVGMYRGRHYKLP
jgi:protein phosphatase